MLWIWLSAAIAAALALAGCGDLSLFDVLKSEETLVLSPESPPVATVGEQIQFSASGGLPPYRFSTAPSPHGSIDPVTGLYTQITEAKDVKVIVIDQAGNTDSTFVLWQGPGAGIKL
jgi:hypothetical protein